MQQLEVENIDNPEWKTPSALTEMPELMPWEIPYVRAFYVLTNSRSISMSIGPLPISEILSYCEFFDVPEPELFLYVMQRCDNAYLDEYQKKEAAKSK